MLKYLCFVTTSIAVDKLQINKLKNKLIYAVLISTFVLCEILAAWNAQAGIRAIETFVFRQAVTIVLAVWYYQSQGSNLTILQRNFLVTLLIPLMFGFSRYFIPDALAIKVNAFFYFSTYVLWILQFKALGAELKISKFPLSYFLFIPLIFTIPFLYYFFVLFPILNHGNKILVLLFALFAASTCVYVLFLPSTKDFSGRHLIIFGIWLTEFTHMMQSYYHFNNEGLFIYPFARILQTTSFIFLLVGMTSYCRRNSGIIIAY